MIARSVKNAFFFWAVPVRRIVLRLLLLLVLASQFPSRARAHVLDEYLQSTLVVVEPGQIRLQMNLTPGVEVADKVLAQIDRDNDSAISTEETISYAENLKSDLSARLDGRDVELQLTRWHIPERAELRTGHGIMRFEFSLAPDVLAAKRLGPGPHQLTIENRHRPSIAAYLFNAAQPDIGAIQITRQTRNQNQSRGEIEFMIEPPGNVPLPFAAVVPVAVLILAALAFWVWKRGSPGSSDAHVPEEHDVILA